MPSRLLLLLPSNTYRATAFLEAAVRLGIPLTVASNHRGVFDAAQPANLLALDFADPERASLRVVEFAREHPVGAVFGVDDDTAVLAARIAHALGIPNSPIDACLAARDKHRQRMLMARAGVRVPAFALHRLSDDVAALALKTEYPCVIKPLRLSMSRGVMRADGAAQFAACVERLRPIVRQSAAPEEFLVEQFVPGAEYAVEAVLEDGALRVLALFDKPDPLDGPFFAETIYVTPSRLSFDDQRRVALCVERAARAIGLDRGPVHAEVRLNEAGPWLIELAARPIGGRCSSVLRFGSDAGHSLEELLLGGAMQQWGGGAVGRWGREDRAAAVYMIPAPRAGTLRAVSGVDEARAVPWIDDVAITALGQSIEPLPEGNRYVGFIYAFAPTPETAVQAVREAHARLILELV